MPSALGRVPIRVAVTAFHHGCTFVPERLEILPVYSLDSDGMRLEKGSHPIPGIFTYERNYHDKYTYSREADEEYALLLDGEV
jgi:hypothetical protein